MIAPPRPQGSGSDLDNALLATTAPGAPLLASVISNTAAALQLSSLAALDDNLYDGALAERDVDERVVVTGAWRCVRVRGGSIGRAHSS